MNQTQTEELNFKTEDYEDVYFEHLLTASYLNADGKIKILEAVLRSINDVEIERAYITLWKSKLENYLSFKRMWFENELTSYFELLIGASRANRNGEIGFPTNEEYERLDNDEKFYKYWFDKWWESEVQVFCKWCVILALEELFNREELYTRMKRASMDINTGLIYQYFKKVLEWLDKQLEKKSIDFEETISKIEVNILPSEFGYLLKKLHEANIITLPHKEKDRNNIIMARVSKAILSAINIKNKTGKDVTEIKLMSGALTDEKCSVKSKRLIEKVSHDLSLLVKKK